MSFKRDMFLSALRKLLTGKFSPIKLPLENPPGKLAPAKFPPTIFPPISLIAFLQLTLCFDNCSQT